MIKYQAIYKCKACRKDVLIDTVCNEADSIKEVITMFEKGLISDEGVHYCYGQQAKQVGIIILAGMKF